LLQNVTINNQTLEYWTMLSYELENYGTELGEINQKIDLHTPFEGLQQPYIFWTDFSVPAGPTGGQPLDTFLDPQGWFKVKSIDSKLKFKIKVVFLGSCIHKRLQFGKILAEGWSPKDFVLARQSLEGKRSKQAGFARI